MNKYQDETDKYAAYPTDAFIDTIYEDSDGPGVVSEPLAWLYPALALNEEAGEVSGKLAKYIRKQDFSADAYMTLRMDISKELGDVLWQTAQVARQFQLDLAEIAEQNLVKLEGRKERGTLIGSGDDR